MVQTLFSESSSRLLFISFLNHKLHSCGHRYLLFYSIGNMRIRWVWFGLVCLVWPMATAMLTSSGTIIHYPGTKFRISILNVVCVAMWSALAILLWRQQIAAGLVFVSYKSRNQWSSQFGCKIL